MRILHTADWHLGQEWMGVERDSDMENHILPELVEIALHEKVDLFIIAGDVFDDPGGRKASLRSCARLLREPFKELLSAGIHIALIPGNHDNRPMFRLLEAVLQISVSNANSRLLVFAQPEVMLIDGVQIVGFPYLKAAHFRRMLHELPAATEMRNQALSVQYEHHLGRMKALQVKPQYPALLIGHFSVSGASLRAETEASGNEVTYARDLTISREALLSNDQVPQYNALGHIHLAQEVPGCVVPTFYAGAPDYFERGQEDYTPQVLIADIPERGSVQVRSVPIATTTPFISKTVSNQLELDSLAGRFASPNLQDRVLGDLTVDAKDAVAYELIYEVASRLFPRLAKANTIRPKLSKANADLRFESTDEYLQLVNPRTTLESFFSQNYTDVQVPMLQTALDVILEELTGED